MSRFNAKSSGFLAVPSKKERQAAFRAQVAHEHLSNEQAVEAARLIPRKIVSEFKLVRWPK